MVDDSVTLRKLFCFADRILGLVRLVTIQDIGRSEVLPAGLQSPFKCYEGSSGSCRLPEG